MRRTCVGTCLLVALLLTVACLGCGKKEPTAAPTVEFAPSEKAQPAPAATEAPRNDAELGDALVVDTIAAQYGLQPEEVAEVQIEQSLSPEDLALAFFLADAAPKNQGGAATGWNRESTDWRIGLASILGTPAWADTNILISIVIRIGGWRSQGIGWGEVAHRLGVHPGAFNKDRVWLQKHAGRDTDDDFRLIVFAVVIQKWFKVPSPEVIVVFKAGQPHIDVFAAVYLGSQVGKPWTQLLREKPKKPDGWVALFAGNNVQVKRPKLAPGRAKPKEAPPGKAGELVPPGKAGKEAGAQPKGKPGGPPGLGKRGGPPERGAGPAAKGAAAPRGKGPGAQAGPGAGGAARRGRGKPSGNAATPKGGAYKGKN